MTNETSDRELVLTRLIDAPREKLYRAWTDATLLKQWFAPLPWTTPHAELDVRPGGASNDRDAEPRGQRHAVPGRVISKSFRTSGWYSRMPIPAPGSHRRSRS